MSNPYTGGRAYKVGIHCHTDDNGDDGDHTPAQVAALCATAGMDAFAITSHYAFANMNAAFAAEGILWLPAKEHTADTLTAGAGSHTTVIGIAGEDATTISSVYYLDRASQQEAIDQCVIDSGFATVAHPVLEEGGNPLPYGTPLAECLSLTDYHGIEVAGPVCAEHYYDAGSSYADGSGGYDNIVDAVLTANGFKALTAASDFHRTLQDPGAKTVYVDEGFQVVYADELTIEAITASLISGNSYATVRGGPTLVNAPRRDGLVTTINTAESCTCVWTKEDGTTAQTDTANTQFSFTSGRETYVRAKFTLVSDTTKHTWTQADFNDNTMITVIESIDTLVYRAYNGKVFSSDGISFYRGVENGDAVSVAAIGLTSY